MAIIRCIWFFNGFSNSFKSMVLKVNGYTFKGDQSDQKLFTSFFRTVLVIKERISSHLCLYEIDFLPMWETSLSHMTMLVLGTIHLKVREKNPPWASPWRIEKSHHRGRNFNHELGKPRLWLKCLPRGWDFPILHAHSWWILIWSVKITFCSPFRQAVANIFL